MLRHDGLFVIRRHSPKQAWALLSLNRYLASPNIFFARHSPKQAWALLSLNRYFSLLEDGDFVERHVGCEFVLQAVDIDELAVELFFVFVELHEEVLPLLLVLLHAPL